MHTPETALLVLTNLPDQTSAQELAQTLIQQRLAACVNILGNCTSVYHWQNRLETASEVPLLIKTTVDRYAELQRTIENLHPYELPEIIAVPLSAGLPAYLDWLHSETLNKD